MARVQRRTQVFGIDMKTCLDVRCGRLQVITKQPRASWVRKSAQGQGWALSTLSRRPVLMDESPQSSRWPTFVIRKPLSSSAPRRLGKPFACDANRRAAHGAVVAGNARCGDTAARIPHRQGARSSEWQSASIGVRRSWRTRKRNGNCRPDPRGVFQPRCPWRRVTPSSPCTNAWCPMLCSKAVWAQSFGRGGHQRE